MKQEIRFEKMKEPMIELYMSIYSEEEVDELNEFYASPLGQKMLSKMPLIFQSSMALSQQMMVDFLPKLKEAQLEFVQELSEVRQTE